MLVSGVYVARQLPNAWIVELADGSKWLVGPQASEEAWQQRRPYRAKYELHPPIGGAPTAAVLALSMGLRLDPTGRMATCGHQIRQRLYERASRSEGRGWEGAAWVCRECGRTLRDDGTPLIPLRL